MIHIQLISGGMFLFNVVAFLITSDSEYLTRAHVFFAVIIMQAFIFAVIPMINS